MPQFRIFKEKMKILSTTTKKTKIIESGFIKAPEI